jgi:hypothetical protein
VDSQSLDFEEVPLCLNLIMLQCASQSEFPANSAYFMHDVFVLRAFD